MNTSEIEIYLKDFDRTLNNIEELLELDDADKAITLHIIHALYCLGAVAKSLKSVVGGD